MPKPFKIASILFVYLCISCSESPYVEFHSYQELSEYEFFSHGWFPEILSEDAFAIQETYDISSRHVFGKFDFKHRATCDSSITNYEIVTKKALLGRIEKIDRPDFPEWFLSTENIDTTQYLLKTHNDFYLIVSKTANRIYFLR